MAARIASLIQQYDSQGEHRTGTVTDHLSARWLARQVKALGLRATLTRFPLSRVDLHACYIQTPERRIDGLPLFDGTFTDATGLTGKLGAAGDDADFGLTIADQRVIASEGEALRVLRQSGQHTALLVVTQGLRSGLTPMNARRFTEPFGIPVLQISSEETTWLTQAAQQRQALRLVIHATRTAAEASNVVVRYPGTDPALPPLVVMTPRSGWWQCAAERGGGIACWLEALRAVQMHGAARSIIFVASSGHELGHRGLEAFIARHPALPKRAHAWIHFGANIGTARDTNVLLQTSDATLERLADAAMARAGTTVQRKHASGTVPGGEVRNIYERGGRYVSLIGSNAFFHHPGDRWPSEVDVMAVARYANAFAALIVALTAS
jgi:hypothetical protein